MLTCDLRLTWVVISSRFNGLAICCSRNANPNRIIGINASSAQKSLILIIFFPGVLHFFPIKGNAFLSNKST